MGTDIELDAFDVIPAKAGIQGPRDAPLAWIRFRGMTFGASANRKHALRENGRTMGISIEGFAIVSSDGMIAAADGFMPNSLKFDSDQEFLCRSLDDATLLVHGRKSHEGQGNSCNRRRLLLTRCVETFSTDPVESNVWLWNPEATPFDDACAAIGVTEGLVAILGGTATYDMFLPRYRAFHLARAGKVHLPDGVPVLSAVTSGLSPGDVLRKHGLQLVREAELDSDHSVVLQKWSRAVLD